jgi:hypothetical protein
MPIPGTVQVTGSIAPTDVSDTYPSHDAIYGKGGQRSVADFAARNAISTARRVEGMLVYTESDGKTWRLLPAPWVGTDLDWEEFASGDPTLGGDLFGTASSATVVGVQGVPVSASAPSAGDNWIYDASASEWVPGPAFSYYVSGAAAQAAAPHINGTYVVISPGSPTSDAGTYQITTNGGAAFPADYTKLSDHTDTAGEVGVVDAGNYYGGTDVEAVLQEIGAGLVSGPTGTLLVATNVIDSILATACEGGDWQILLENGTLRYKTTLSVAHDGATASATESASVPGPGVGVLPVTFDADISGGQLRILATASAVGWSYRVRRLALMVV